MAGVPMTLLTGDLSKKERERIARLRREAEKNSALVQEIQQAPAPIESAVAPAVSTPSRAPRDPTEALAARFADYEANAKKNAALYRAAAMQEGGALEGIPIGQGAGGGFLTLGGVALRLAERNARIKEAEKAAAQFGPAASARASLMNQLDRLGSQRLQYQPSDYQVNQVPIGSPLSLGAPGGGGQAQAQPPAAPASEKMGFMDWMRALVNAGGF